MLDFSNRSAVWHGAEKSKNAGHEIHFKNAGRENIFEVLKKAKNYEIQLQMNHVNPNYANLNHTKSIFPDQITADLTNIKPENQHNLADSCSLHKIML